MISDIALVVTAVGVIGVVVGLRQNYRERLRQFESRYVERYWKILDQLSLDAVRGELAGEICESDEKAIRSYISLCEDELEMRHYSYIADSTYELWGEVSRISWANTPSGVCGSRFDKKQKPGTVRRSFIYINSWRPAR